MSAPDPPSLAFDSETLARDVEALTPEEIDRLPFGVIRLDADGAVQLYSEAERRASGSGRRPRVGLDFFDKVAPCMNTADVRGRIQHAQASGTLDIEIGHVGDFDDPDRAMVMRALSASNGGVWLFLDRDRG